MFLPFELVDKRQTEILQIPIKQVPHGYTVGSIAVCGVFLFLTWTTFFTRWLTRAFFGDRGKDDLAMLVTMIFFSVYCGGVISLELLVSGKTVLPSALMTKLTNILMMTEVFYIWTMMILKVSIALFFCRILQGKWQRIVIYGIASLSVVFGFAYFLFAVFQCGVPEQGAQFWIKKATTQCVNVAAILGFGYSHAVISAGTDVILSAMPIPVMRRANINTVEMAMLCCILFLAAAGSAASCIRVDYVKVLASADPDFWSDVQPLAIWSAIEPGLGIMAANLATLRPLLRQIVQIVKSWNSTRKSRAPILTQIGGRSGHDQKSKALDSGAGALPERSMSSPFPATTHPMSSLQTSVPGNGRFHLSTANQTAPLSSLYSDENGLRETPLQSPIGGPQSLVPGNLHPGPYVSTSGDDPLRATWWDLPSTSLMPHAPRQSTEFAARATQADTGSEQQYVTTSQPVELPEPQLEAGYRRWVIWRPQLRRDRWRSSMSMDYSNDTPY